MLEDIKAEDVASFITAASAAKKAGKKKFSIGGKTYPVTIGKALEQRVAEMSEDDIIELNDKKKSKYLTAMKARLNKEDTGISIARKMMQITSMRHLAETIAEMEIITPDELQSIVSEDLKIAARSLFLENLEESEEIVEAEKNSTDFDFDGVMVRITRNNFDNLDEDMKNNTVNEETVSVDGVHMPVLFVAETRQMKNDKTETMVQKNGKVKVIDKKDEKKFLAMGYTLAECMELQIEAASPEKIMKDIAALEKMLTKIGGNSSSVKMKKVALERKIAKLEKELEDMDEETQESYSNYKKKLKEYGYGPAKKKMKTDETYGKKKMKEAMEKGMPPGEHVFGKEVDGKMVMVHKLEKTGKFCAYVDGKKIGDYDDLKSAKSAAMDSMKEAMEKGMPAGEHVFDKKVDGKEIMVHKLDKSGKFCAYVDGDKIGEYDDLAAAKKAAMDSLNETYGKMNAKKLTWKDYEKQGNDAWMSRVKRKDNPYKKNGPNALARTSWFDGWDNMKMDSDAGDFDESYGKMNASKMSSKEKAKNRALSKADRDAQPKGKVSLKPMPASLAKKMKEDFVKQMNIIVEGGELEQSIEESMSPKQIDALKKSYDSLRGKKIDAKNGMKISKTLEKLDKKSLIDLMNADIPFVSTLAVNKLMMNHDMSAAEINKVRKESVELGESAGDMEKAAAELETYAKKNGGMDKNAFMRVANLLKTGHPDKLKSYVNNMDTDPREYVAMLLKKHMGKKSTEKMMDIKFRGESISWEDAETLRAAGVKLDEISGDMKKRYNKAALKDMDKQKNTLKRADDVGSKVVDGAVTDKASPSQTNSRFAKLSKIRQKADKKLANRRKGLSTPGKGSTTKVKDYFGMSEEISGSGYELYHKTLGSAIDTAITHAKLKFGIDITPDERMEVVGMGPRKPSNGKTNTYRLMGNKGKAIQVQVYNRGGSRPYELNMYKE